MDYKHLQVLILIFSASTQSVLNLLHAFAEKPPNVLSASFGVVAVVFTSVCYLAIHFINRNKEIL